MEKDYNSINGNSSPLHRSLLATKEIKTAREKGDTGRLMELRSLAEKYNPDRVLDLDEAVSNIERGREWVGYWRVLS